VHTHLCTDQGKWVGSSLELEVRRSTLASNGYSFRFGIENPGTTCAPQTCSDVCACADICVLFRSRFIGFKVGSATAHCDRGTEWQSHTATKALAHALHGTLGARCVSGFRNDRIDTKDRIALTCAPVLATPGSGQHRTPNCARGITVSKPGV